MFSANNVNKNQSSSPPRAQPVLLRLTCLVCALRASDSAVARAPLVQWPNNRTAFDWLIPRWRRFPGEKGSQRYKTPEKKRKHGFVIPGHANSTICSLLRQSCSKIFTLFDVITGEPISLLPLSRKMRKGDSKVNDTGVSGLGAFKLGHFQPYKRIFSKKCPRFSLHTGRTNS